MNTINLSSKDFEQLKKKGISKEKVLHQLQTFKAGIPYVALVQAAGVSKGILQLSTQEQKTLVRHFEAVCHQYELLKFVPASGAASRMFTKLFHFLETYHPTAETLATYISRTGDTTLQKFIDGIEHLPFYHKVMKRISGKAANKDKAVYRFVREMLGEDRLDYGCYPKALLPFHNYGAATATPFEEHIKEAALYAKTNGKARLHFTISEQHEALFRAKEAEVVPSITQATCTNFEIAYSHQKPATDTIAVDSKNRPFRDHTGAITFRPGGHGALIENLNEQDADIIFIKNIDNVAVDRNLKEVATYKKMLAGLLITIQTQAFEYAEALEAGHKSGQKAAEIQTFLEEKLNVCLPEDYASMELAAQYAVLGNALNRPIRVCGMIQAEGDPGGGPFWVKDANGHNSLQIVEAAQIDDVDKKQAAIAKSATHFNPVDLVCGVRNYKGEKYNLLEFVDPRQGFITTRTKAGKTIKALELPGLWNGSMAFWNTVFVEVPRITFNPVKTVTDLLKPTHQAQNSLPQSCATGGR